MKYEVIPSPMFVNKKSVYDKLTWL